MIFFTADSHYGHGRIIEYCARPFKYTDEMNKTLIDNWNSVVKKNDIIYHLGDFGMGSPDYLNSIFKELAGNKYLIIGSHDKTPVLHLPWICLPKSVTLVKIDWGFFGLPEGPDIFLSHYPHRSWPKSFHGSWHLFGHTHGRLTPWGKSFDVGVDCNNFTPVSLNQVREKMKGLSWDEKEKG